MEILKKYEHICLIEDALLQKCQKGNWSDWKRLYIIQDNDEKVAIVSLNVFERMLDTLLKICGRSYSFKKIFGTKTVKVLSPDNLRQDSQNVLIHSPLKASLKKETPQVKNQQTNEKKEEIKSSVSSNQSLKKEEKNPKITSSIEDDEIAQQTSTTDISKKKAELSPPSSKEKKGVYHPKKPLIDDQKIKNGKNSNAQESYKKPLQEQPSSQIHQIPTPNIIAEKAQTIPNQESKDVLVSKESLAEKAQTGPNEERKDPVVSKEPLVELPKTAKGEIYCSSDVPETFKNSLNSLMTRFSNHSIYVISFISRVDHIDLPEHFKNFKNRHPNMICLILQVTDLEINEKSLLDEFKKLIDLPETVFFGKIKTKWDQTGMGKNEIYVENQTKFLESIEKKLNSLET